jgi:BirA family biotin operon repressor/biotin-[acetyl-CoA-carboxylase] ligase
VSQRFVEAVRLTALLEHDCRLSVVESTTTTNDEVLAFARRDSGHKRVRMGDGSVARPLVVVSAEQTAGRGRLGRTWVSPPGGVYLSALLEVDPGASNPRAALASLSPLAALATCEALQAFVADDLRVKWPNDVVSERGKLAGILVEVKSGIAGGEPDTPSEPGEPSTSPQPGTPSVPSTSPQPGTPGTPSQPDASPSVIVGIGANVNRPQEGAFAGAAYLSDTSAGPLSLEEVAAAIINRLLDYYQSWRAGGCVFAPFVAKYRARMALVGTRVWVRDARGTEVASGVVAGVDETARLLLTGDQGTTPIVSGEVTLRNPL